MSLNCIILTICFGFFLTMSSRPSNFSVEDYSYMKPIETMHTLSSSDTIESKELNIDTHSSAANIINFHRNENHTNNPVYQKECIEEFDKVLSSFGNQYDCQKDDLNYDILDLDNLEYITYKSTKSTDADAKFDGRSDIKYLLYEHNYCMIEEAIPMCAETLDTSKPTDPYKTEEKSFVDIPYFNGVDYNVGELEESLQFYDTECNLRELNVESVDFVIPNYISTDNISIYTISDEEDNDIEAPELDVISISSASSIEDRFDVNNVYDSNSCGYHSSDFEFIEEHEATRDGLIINYKPQAIKGNKVKTIEIAKEYNSQELILDYFHVPAVSNNIEYKIPKDNNYISMFESNIPYPVHCMKNKSIYASNCSMNADYQGLGFNMGLFDREKVDKHVQDEANESENKILFMYPSENRRQRRRI